MFLQISEEVLDSKQLYFSALMAMQQYCKPNKNGKYDGVYAIYNNSKCLYVGYSTNLPSRISTHFFKSYPDATKFELFSLPILNGVDCLQERKKILLDNEKYLMSFLRPCDNIMYDLDFDEENIDREDYSAPSVSIARLCGSRVRIYDDFSSITEGLHPKVLYLMVGELLRQEENLRYEVEKLPKNTFVTEKVRKIIF